MDKNNNPETQTLFDVTSKKKIARLHKITSELERLKTEQGSMANEMQELINERHIIKKELMQAAKEKISNI